MLSFTSDDICKGVSLNLSRSAGKPVLAFFKFRWVLVQIYHDFHIVVAWFRLGAVTGTNGSTDLHVKLEIRFGKAALPRAVARCALHRITLITGYSANLFSLLQKIQKYIFSRKKKRTLSILVTVYRFLRAFWKETWTSATCSDCVHA